MSTTVLYLGLFCFAMVLILVTLLRFGVFASIFASEGVCQSSLQLTKIAGQASPSCMVPATKAVKLNCPRSFISIDNGAVIKGDDVMTGYYDRTCPSGVASDSCLEHNVVAEEMNSCWNLFFQGEEVVLQQVDVNAVSLMTSKDLGTACFICSQIKLEKGAPEFVEYLQKKEVREGVTYYAALAQNRQAFCDEVFTDYFPNCWEAMASGQDLSKWSDAGKVAASIATAIPINVVRDTLPDHFTQARPNIRPTSLTQGEEYAVVFIRRGLGSCEDPKNKDSAVLTHSYLTNTVQVIPIQQVTQVCGVVIA